MQAPRLIPIVPFWSIVLHSQTSPTFLRNCAVAKRGGEAIQHMDAKKQKVVPIVRTAPLKRLMKQQPAEDTMRQKNTEAEPSPSLVSYSSDSEEETAQPPKVSCDLPRACAHFVTLLKVYTVP